jgi:hypothetical protein
MGKLLDCLRDQDAEFIAQQKVFFVATAPLSKDHHVNVSPKSPGTSLTVLDPHTVAYLDLTGSGSETAAHVAENGRMTILFCALEEGPPKLMRLHGNARVVLREHEKDALFSRFPKELTSSPGFRAVYILKADRISTSCGFSMPILKFDSHRQILHNWTESRGRQGMLEYGIKKNSFSIDGISSLAVIRSKQEQSDFKIVPKPSDGYIYGVKVPANHFLSMIENIKSEVQRQQKLNLYGLSMFLIGVVVGTFLQWFSQHQALQGSDEF